MKTATASLSSAHTLSLLENNKRGANHLFNPQFNLILFFQRSMTLERGTEKGERERVVVSVLMKAKDERAATTASASIMNK